MKITYDPKHNIAYIKFRDTRDEIKTIHLSEEVNIDVSSDGKVSGIELLNANTQLKATKSKGKNVTFTNESTGKTIEIPLPM